MRVGMRRDAVAGNERDHGVIRNVFPDHGIRADLDVVADANRAEDARARRDIDIVADDRRAVCGSADGHLL